MSDEPIDEMADFRDQCRRAMARPIQDRMKYGFCYVYKPVLDDAEYRVFDSMQEYREWCHKNLPQYLGYRIAGRDDAAALNKDGKEA